MEELEIPKVVPTRPRVTIPKLKRMCRLLRSWRSQTHNKSVQCRRHHLQNDVLVRFERSEWIAAVTWAEIGRGGILVTFEDVYEAVTTQFDCREVVNAVYEFDEIERFIPEGLATVQGVTDEGKNPETNEAIAKAAAVVIGEVFSEEG